MAPLRLTGFLCGAVIAVALEVQKPHVALAQSSLENSTLHSDAAGKKTELTAAGSQHKATEAIQPSLAPQSHKKFFGKDYPDDLRPTIDTAPKWSYPYPKVQSDEKYDADYVKDENADGGHWKAQMDYDEIKMKYVKQQALVRAAALREGMEKDEAMKAAKIKDEVWLRKNNADAEASKAAEDASAALDEYDTATKEEKAKEWEAAKKAGKTKEEFEAEQKVKNAELYLKDCQKALDDAKAELERALSADAAKLAIENQAKADAVQAAKAKQAGKNGTSAAKNATAIDKQGKASAADKEAQSAKIVADKESADDEKAIGSLKEEQAKLARLSDALKEAEAKLRKFRGEPALSEGAQFNADGSPTHSGAKQLSAWFILTMAGLVATTA